MSLRTGLKALLRPNVRLSQYCTMQVGGPARYFAEPATEEELLELLDFARAEGLAFLIMGKGSNVIFPDEGYDGLVITLLHYEQERIVFDGERTRVTASAGIFLYRLALACRDNGLGGAEFLANIPGTVGGAAVMNAGFSRFPGQRNEIGDVLDEVSVLGPDGQKQVLRRRELEFGYRRSNLEGRIVLEAVLQLWRRDPEEIQREIRANFEYRNTKQDLRYPSSGSIFKNPGPDLPSAGQLIDRLGLKGRRVGGAMVSLKHGNYFINAGQAKSADLVELIRQVQRAVREASGIFLEPEVRIISPRPPAADA